MTEQLWVSVYQPVLTWLPVPVDRLPLAIAEGSAQIERRLHGKGLLTPDHDLSQHKPHLELLMLPLSRCTPCWFPTVRVHSPDVLPLQAWMCVFMVVSGAHSSNT